VLAPLSGCHWWSYSVLLLFKELTNFLLPGPARNEPLFTPREAVYKLADPSKPDVPVRTLKLTQNIGGHCLIVYASEFNPQEGDVISYKWKDPRTGKMKVFPTPPFCLTNIDKVQQHLHQYILSATTSYVDTLKSDHELAKMTAKMAMAYAQTKRVSWQSLGYVPTLSDNGPFAEFLQDSLTARSLRLWAICRIIEIPWQMCGEDTLGVSRIDDPYSPRYGMIPIPPIMDTQLDQIVIQKFLYPLREKLIKQFEKLISPPYPQHWFDIYLSSFVLLNHIEHLAKHSAFFAKLNAMDVSISFIKSVIQEKWPFQMLTSTFK